jgi:pyrroline-5-carboxylate reductase
MDIGIIGCGNMGTAIARRLSKKYNVALYDRDPKWTKELSKEIHAKACSDMRQLALHSAIIFLAVKPQNLDEVAEKLTKHLTPNHLVISVLSGIRLDKLQQKLGDASILRMMPNLAIAYGKGVLGLASIKKLSLKFQKELKSICHLLGKEIWLSEDQIDAITSLAGSGPAFFYVMIEAMIDSAISMGFSASQGKELVLQMIEGSLAILRETGQHPAELKSQICSPAGTTIAGLKVMEDHGIRKAILHTFSAAYLRAKEMGEKLE